MNIPGNYQSKRSVEGGMGKVYMMQIWSCAGLPGHDRNSS
jgi:hypothetical protein